MTTANHIRNLDLDLRAAEAKVQAQIRELWAPVHALTRDIEYARGVYLDRIDAFRGVRLALQVPACSEDDFDTDEAGLMFTFHWPWRSQPAIGWISADDEDLDREVYIAEGPARWDLGAAQFEASFHGIGSERLVVRGDPLDLIAWAAARGAVIGLPNRSQIDKTVSTVLARVTRLNEHAAQEQAWAERLRSRLEALLDLLPPAPVVSDDAVIGFTGDMVIEK